MPKRKTSGKSIADELPNTLRRSSRQAQETFARAQGSAMETYGEAQRASREAYTTLKRKFDKVGDHWVRKGRSPVRRPAVPRQREGQRAAASGVDEARSSKDELMKAAASLGIRGRSKMTKAELADAINATRTDHRLSAAPVGTAVHMVIPQWLDPQLAMLTKDRFSDPAWVFERKLDGERCLAFCDDNSKMRLLTRNQKDVTSTFAEVARALAEQAANGFVVDGEIVSFAKEQTSFARLQQRLGVANPSPGLVAKFPVTYYVFDVLYAGGADTRALPQLDRKDKLAGLLSFGGPLVYTEHRVGDGEEFYRSACADGWEGLIAKRADAPYRAGRTRNWLKFKCVSGQELVIGGYTDPRGSREGLGALLLGYYDSGGQLTYAGKVGTGFSASTLRSLHGKLADLARPTSPFTRGDPPRAAHWAEPFLVAQIGFAEWTTDGKLRQPRFEGLREDKAAADVVREVPR